LRDDEMHLSFDASGMDEPDIKDLVIKTIDAMQSRLVRRAASESQGRVLRFCHLSRSCDVVVEPLTSVATCRVDVQEMRELRR